MVRAEAAEEKIEARRACVCGEAACQSNDPVDAALEDERAFGTTRSSSAPLFLLCGLCVNQ